VISTILQNLLIGLTPLNTVGSCKIKGNMYGQHKEEGLLIVRGNYLCTGVLDKNHVGASANGLVHAVFEAHGPRKAGLFLTILGRLFTHFQQVRADFLSTQSLKIMCPCIHWIQYVSGSNLYPVCITHGHARKALRRY
jgi:DNA-directed RNA polymerase I subunit RPA1